MTTVHTVTRSFAGGEIAPELYGRLDLDKFQTGLAECRNLIVLPHGPARNRPGFAYVNAVANSAKKTRLIPFTFSETQTMVLELGDGTIRFHTGGGSLLEAAKTVTGIAGAVVTSAAHGYAIGDSVYLGGRFYTVTAVTTDTFTVAGLFGQPAAPTGTTVARQYQISSPYTEAQLFDIHYVQSADVLALVHPAHPVRELRRLGPTNWQLTAVNFGMLLAVPTGVTATIHETGTTTLKRDYSYVVTAVNATGIEESEASAVVTVNTNLGQNTNYNTIAWAAVTGAARYNVYRKQGGVFGYIGQTAGLSLDDNNITPDTLRTPPTAFKPFETAGNYPAAVGYFDQRRVFAATDNAPQTLWMTKPGSETNLTSSLPLQDDDGISFRVAAREYNRIRHLIPLSDLILLTAGGEWRVFTGSGDPVTPSTIIARPQSYVGASNVQPVVTSLSAIYVSAKGSKFRELIYSAEGVGTYKSEDLSVLTPHLVDGYQVQDLAFSRGPVPILWAVRNDGTLLGLTYLPDQLVRAWHQHDTQGGVFESVCCVSEGNEDALYAVVRRTLFGQQVRYVERLGTQIITALEDAFVVDCGLTYTGAPTTTIGGLHHLEGETVAVLGDGAVFPQRVVTNGEIQLDHAVSKCHVGLPITATLKTLPLSLSTLDTGGAGFAKNVAKVYLRVHHSSGVFVGPALDQLVEHKQRTSEPWGSPPQWTTGEIEVPVPTTWTRDGAIYVQQRAPLPLTVQAMALEVQLAR